MSASSRSGLGPGVKALLSAIKPVAPLFVLALLLTACGGEYPQSSVDPATDFAETIHSLYVQVFWWTMLILAVVWGVLAYILIRFRERPDSPEPRQTHGNLAMEVAWTIGPAIIVVAIAIPTIRAVFATQAEPEGDPLRVEVVGHRFWWEFRYPESGVVTANELHVPVDRPISLRLHSADVIHSFWVPRLGGKRDVNPVVATPEGENPEYTWLHFTVRDTGTYSGQCAEFCGTSHSLMGVRVVAQTPDDFRRWEEEWQTPSPTAVPAPGDGQEMESAQDTADDSGSSPQEEMAREGTAEDPLVAQGRDVFHNQSFCVACHAINGTNAQGQLGPNLTRLGARSTLGGGLLENTRENLERWIRDPRAFKPGAEMPGVNEEGGGWPATGLTDEQVRAVAAYLSSLN